MGACGFLGSRLAVRLLKEGYCVRILDQHRRQWNLPESNSNLEEFCGNVLDVKLLDRCLHGVDVLFQFAGQTLPASSNIDPVADVSSNLVGNLQILQQAVKQGVQKVIYPSSGGTVYGITSTGPSPISEDHQTNPISSYGIVKLAVEKYLALFERLHGLNYVVLRIGNPYGIGQDPFRGFGVIASCFGAVVQGRPIRMWGDGSVIRDFIHVDDVVEAGIKAIGYDGSERIFNIGTGIGTSIASVVHLVQEVADRRCEVVELPARNVDVPEVVLDVRRAGVELNWSPTVSLPEGLRLTWNSYKEELLLNQGLVPQEEGPGRNGPIRPPHEIYARPCD